MNEVKAPWRGHGVSLSGRANVKLGESHRLELGDWAQLPWKPVRTHPPTPPTPRYLGIGFAFRVTGCHLQGMAEVAGELVADLFGLGGKHWDWGRGTERRVGRRPYDFLRDPDFLPRKIAANKDQPWKHGCGDS